MYPGDVNVINVKQAGNLLSTLMSRFDYSNKFLKGIFPDATNPFSDNFRNSLRKISSGSSNTQVSGQQSDNINGQLAIDFTLPKVESYQDFFNNAKAAYENFFDNPGSFPQGEVMNADQFAEIIKDGLFKPGDFISHESLKEASSRVLKDIELNQEKIKGKHPSSYEQQKSYIALEAQKAASNLVFDYHNQYRELDKEIAAYMPLPPGKKYDGRVNYSIAEFTSDKDRKDFPSTKHLALMKKLFDDPGGGDDSDSDNEDS